MPTEVIPTQVFFLVLVAAALGLAGIAATFFTVEQRTIAMVQRLGKFVREAGPGLHVKVPFIDKVIGRVNLRVQQLDVTIETKTEDNVFVEMVVAVQYFVLPEKVYDAFYKLDDANRQITSFVFDGRGRCPGQGLARSGHRRPTEGDRRGPPRLGGRVSESRAGHNGEGRDEPRSDDPVLRHAEGDRSLIAHERDSHPTFTGQSRQPDRADAHRHDRSGSDGPRARG